MATIVKKTVKKGLNKPAKKTTFKKTGRKLSHPNAVEIIDENGDVKTVSRTWVAILKAQQNPGIEIVDMRAVLK